MFGRLELWTEDGNGGVCGINFGMYEANLACHDMGFPGGSVLSPNIFGQVFFIVVYLFFIIRRKEFITVI